MLKVKFSPRQIVATTELQTSAVREDNMNGDEYDVYQENDHVIAREDDVLIAMTYGLKPCDADEYIMRVTDNFAELLRELCEDAEVSDSYIIFLLQNKMKELGT